MPGSASSVPQRTFERPAAPTLNLGERESGDEGTDLMKYLNDRKRQIKSSLSPHRAFLSSEKWEARVRQEVACASNNPEKASQWFQDVDAASTMEELRDSGSFPTLDAKIASAFGEILRGELGRQIHVLEEKLALEMGK